MDDIQDWLRRIDAEAWQRRIRQLRQELRDEKNQPQGSQKAPIEDLPLIEVGGKSLPARLPKNRVLDGI